MSQYHALLGNTSSIGSNIIYTPTEENIKPGEDFVVYDKFEDKYKALRGRSYEETSFDNERYETNWDVVIGHKDGVTHAVAKDDAYNQTDTVQDDTAAAPCYYRIEIDNTQDGGFHYDMKSSDSQEGNVSWSANDTMQSILNQISVPPYSGKVVLNDGTGIGIYLGGYSSNTCQITDITGTVTVVDMSQFATEEDYSENEYKGSEQYSIRPTADGVLANKPRFDGNGNAEIKSLYGNSIVWNQLLNITSVSTENFYVNSGTTQYVDGEIIFVCNAIGGNINLYPKRQLNTHKNLYVFDVKSDIEYNISINSNNISINSNQTAISTTYKRIYYIINTNGGYLTITDNHSADYQKIYLKNFQKFDLTQMFGEGNEPTIEQFKQWFPLDYYEYNEGEIINVNIDGLKTIGFNQWNEEWEKYGLNYYTGKINTGIPNGIHSKNYIKIFPNTDYYIKSPQPIVICGYDVNYNYVRGLHYKGGNMMFNTKECNYIKFGTFNDYGATYNNDICINLSWSGYRNGDYEPYNEHNISIPVKEIKDGNGNLLFPDGLTGFGNFTDVVTSDKAVKRYKKTTLHKEWINQFVEGYFSNGDNLIYAENIKSYITDIGGEGIPIINTVFTPCVGASGWSSLTTESVGSWGANTLQRLAFRTKMTKTQFDSVIDGLEIYYTTSTPIEVEFKDVPQSFGDKLNLAYTYDPYGTEEFLYDSEDIKVPASTSNIYESHMYASAPYTEKNQTINDSFKNWRGVSAQTILGSSKIPVGPNNSCLCNTNMNYSYRSGANFSGWKSWASTNGTTTFTTDGVNGTTNSSASVVMSQSTFNSNVNNTFAESTPNGKMYDYYNRLLNSEGNKFAYLHNQYIERYGTMSTLYDAYLMSHMVNTDNPSSGITYTAMNMGKQLTEVKGRVMAVDYNYNYVPAYPPEYNALHYGVSNKDSMFSKGRYSHPEVYDLGLMFRDDIMQKCNTNWSKIKGIKYTALANNMYRGSCAECHSDTTWIFAGSTRCIAYNGRYYAYFRSRPVLCFNN